MAVTEARAAADVVVAGRVQGVGYRAFAERCARRLGLTGFVMNLADGHVRVHAEGARPGIEALLAELRRGPRHAVVGEVLVTWTAPTDGYHSFDTRLEEPGG
jgi:acylphosphatase